MMLFPVQLLLYHAGCFIEKHLSVIFFATNTVMVFSLFHPVSSLKYQRICQNLFPNFLLPHLAYLLTYFGRLTDLIFDCLTKASKQQTRKKGFFDLIFHYSNFLGSGPEGAGSSRSQSQAIEDQSDVSSKGSDSTTRQQASAIASSSSMMEETTNENDLQVQK